MILNIYRAILQHQPDLIFQWDVLLLTVMRSVNTRYIKKYGFTPTEILLGFTPRFADEDDEF